MSFWDIPNAWTFSLAIWVFIVSVNAIHVKGYGELGGYILPLFRTDTYFLTLIFMTLEIEYWLASIKVATIVVFILLGILVNVGVNRDHHFIGFENWKIPGAPFVGGFGGFARVFVTASFACKLFHVNSYRQLIMPRRGEDGGTESLGVTAGETENPAKNMPRVIKFVFWRYEFTIDGPFTPELTYSIVSFFSTS